MFLFLLAIKNPDAVAKLLRVMIAFWSNAMGRIIHGDWCERKKLDSVKVTAVQTSSGHIEILARNEWVWHSVDAVDFSESANPHGFGERDIESVEERKARSLENASARARKNVRLACKSINADTLLTLTYRENVTSLDECKSDLKEFVRRLRRVIPEFTAIAGFEQQKRGAWHVHMATVALPASIQTKSVRVKSFDLIRSVWRSVTKSKGGNIDVSRRKTHSRKTPARIASYLSKYITKAFTDGEKWSNRWTKFGRIAKPRVIELGTVGTMREAIALAYSLISDSQSLATAFIGQFKDMFFLAAEPKRGGQWRPV
jgi:hypothetical protein